MATHTIKVTLADGMPLQGAEVHHNSGICNCSEPATLPVVTPHNGMVMITLDGDQPHTVTINVNVYDSAGNVIDVLQKTVTTRKDITGSGQYMAECRFNR